LINIVVCVSVLFIGTNLFLLFFTPWSLVVCTFNGLQPLHLRLLHNDSAFLAQLLSTTCELVYLLYSKISFLLFQVSSRRATGRQTTWPGSHLADRDSAVFFKKPSGHNTAHLYNEPAVISAGEGGPGFGGFFPDLNINCFHFAKVSVFSLWALTYRYCKNLSTCFKIVKTSLCVFFLRFLCTGTDTI
jgi:hypothetical protein